jgi:lipopolysaccharide transport system permease protein
VPSVFFFEFAQAKLVGNRSMSDTRFCARLCRQSSTHQGFIVRTLKNLYNYRHFIFQSVRDDYRRRYVRSKFALFWTVLQPVVQVTVFALIFSGMLGARLPGVAGTYSFGIYLLSGILIWGLFADALNRTTTVFVEFGSQIKKIVFPKILPISIAAGIAITNFLILLSITLIFLSIVGTWPGWRMVELIPATLCAVALGASLGLMLGVLNVFMRDVGQVVSIVMTFWFWLTPIIYQTSALPKGIRAYVEANPVTPIVQSFQVVLLEGRSPSFAALLYPFIVASVAAALGVFLLRRASPQMADAL